MQIKDARGHVALQYTYDSVGRVVEEMHYDQLRRQHNYAYSSYFISSANAVQTLDTDQSVEADYKGSTQHVTVRYYDLLGNLIVLEEGFPEYLLS